jgi:hypothetical protein
VYDSRLKIEIIERMVRFHILAAHRLGSLGEDQFSSKQNTDRLNDLLGHLRNDYPILHKNNVVCENEYEFWCYTLLFLFDTLPTIVPMLRVDVIESPPVQVALAFYAAVQECNYMRFFALIKRSPYLVACLLHKQFYKVRLQALKIFNKAYNRNYFPVKDACELLAFDSTKQTCDFFLQHGIPVDGGMIQLTHSTVTHPKQSQANQRSQRIENKVAHLQIKDIVSTSMHLSDELLQLVIPPRTATPFSKSPSIRSSASLAPTTPTRSSLTSSKNATSASPAAAPALSTLPANSLRFSSTTPTPALNRALSNSTAKFVASPAMPATDPALTAGATAASSATTYFGAFNPSTGSMFAPALNKPAATATTAGGFTTPAPILTQPQPPTTGAAAFPMHRGASVFLQASALDANSILPSTATPSIGAMPALPTFGTMQATAPTIQPTPTRFTEPVLSSTPLLRRSSSRSSIAPITRQPTPPPATATTTAPFTTSMGPVDTIVDVDRDQDTDDHEAVTKDMQQAVGGDGEYGDGDGDGDDAQQEEGNVAEQDEQDEESETEHEMSEDDEDEQVDEDEQFSLMRYDNQQDAEQQYAFVSGALDAEEQLRLSLHSIPSGFELDEVSYELSGAMSTHIADDSYAQDTTDDGDSGAAQNDHVTLCTITPKKLLESLSNVKSASRQQKLLLWHPLDIGALSYSILHAKNANTKRVPALYWHILLAVQTHSIKGRQRSKFSTVSMWLAQKLHLARGRDISDSSGWTIEAQDIVHDYDDDSNSDHQSWSRDLHINASQVDIVDNTPKDQWDKLGSNTVNLSAVQSIVFFVTCRVSRLESARASLQKQQARLRQLIYVMQEQLRAGAPLAILYYGRVTRATAAQLIGLEQCLEEFDLQRHVTMACVCLGKDVAITDESCTMLHNAIEWCAYYTPALPALRKRAFKSVVYQQVQTSIYDAYYYYSSTLPQPPLAEHLQALKPVLGKPDDFITEFNTAIENAIETLAYQRELASAIPGWQQILTTAIRGTACSSLSLYDTRCRISVSVMIIYTLPICCCCCCCCCCCTLL